MWRLLSYAFLHSEGSIFHILFNMLWLYGLGRFVEAKLGSREFLLFYLLSAVAGGLMYAGLELAFPSLGGVRGPDGEPVRIMCVGASGAVMGVILISALWDPFKQISLILFSVPLWVIAGLYVVLETYAVLFQIGSGGSSADGVAHGAHFGGLALAYAYHPLRLAAGGRVGAPDRAAAAVHLRRREAVRRSPAQGATAPARRSAPDAASDDPPDDLEEQADAVLAKIHASGEASLTRRERKTLKLYSERAKAKRGG